MNPYKLSQVYKQLTSQNSILKKYLKLGTKDIKQPDLPAFVEQKNVVNEFMRRNPRPDQVDRKDMAGGGMLVQPSADGSRPGYAKDKKGYGQDAAPLTKEQKKNIKLYNKNVEKYGGVKFEDIPNTGKGNSDKRYGIKTGKITGTGYDFDRSKIDYRESAAYKKSITPKGYISSTELFELIDNPKLKSGNFQQARKFERNPKKYPGKKNYVYNYIKKLLNEKQVGKAGSESLAAQKFFYRKPTKAELDKINSFIDSRILETGTVNNVKIFHKEFGKLFEGKKTKGFFNDTLSLDKARAALKKYGINATDSQLARAMMRLGQIYDGHTFQNEINIPKNKSAGKFIEKSFNELDIYNGWRSASYDAAMDDINKVMAKSSGDIRSFKYTLNNYIKENYPQIFKNYDVNEIFSLTTSSVRGSYPYAYFIDLTKNDINQKALSSFQGKASIAEGKIQKAITNFRRTGNKKFYDEAVRVADVFNNTTRKNFLSDERIIKVGGVNALKLEIGSQQQIKDKVGFASEYYKKNNLKKWKDQGIDIDAHTAKSGYVKTFDGKTPPKGVVTFQDVVKDGKVDEKQFNNLLAKIGCPNKVFKASGGRVGYQDGTDICPTKGAQMINSGMKNATPAQLKNFAVFANRARALGRGIMKFGIIPEAMYVAADSAIRLTMGDKPTEALLRASEYLLPGDQTKLAEMMEATRLMNPETAAIIGRSIDYKNQLAKIQSLEDTRANLENLSGGGEFDYIGDLNNDVRNLDNQIKQATDALNTKFKMTDAELTYADAMQAEVDDIRKSKSLITKLQSMFRDTDQASDVETLGAPEVTQKQLNQRLRPQLPRDLLLAPESELIDYAKHQQSQGFDIPDNYYLQQQKDIKNMSLAELAAATSPEQVYGFQGHMGEPLNKGVVEKPQNVISDMEREITGQTNVANPFDVDLSMIGSGLRGFSAAGGGIAKQAGVDSGVPPESGPNPQGLSYLMKRGKNI